MIQHFYDFMTQHCGLLPWKAVNETRLRNVGPKMIFLLLKMTIFTEISHFLNLNWANSKKIEHFHSKNWLFFVQNHHKWWFYQDFTMLVPGPQLNWNGGSPIDRSCRIIKRNLTNIQDFVLLILLFQIVIVTLRLFWETLTPIKSLWKDDQNGYRKFKRSTRRWNSWKIFRYEGSGPSKTRFMWVYLAKMTNWFEIRQISVKNAFKLVLSKLSFSIKNVFK